MTTDAAPSRRRRTAWPRAVAAVVIACWLAAVAVPPLALVAWRDRRLAEIAGPEAQAEWDAFRADMQKQSGTTGPVQRKVPKSVEPPELVWLRDYHRLAITAWVTLVGVLGGFLSAIAVGLARDASDSAAEHRPAGERHDQKQHERDSQHTDKRRHG